MMTPRVVPAWVHGWAVFTVIATLPLLTLGGEVTTRQVGMADPVWPTTPWYLATNDLTGQSVGFLIEHSHRLAGYVVGCCAIVLAAATWFTARDRRVAWLGPLALASVIGQGLLGGFRVRLNALAGTDLAAVHGVFAQVVLSLLVCVAVLTAAPRGGAMPSGEALRFRRLSLALAGVAFLQLVWGAWLRHAPSGVPQRLHLMTAFAVVAVGLWLVATSRSSPAASERLGRAGPWLVGLLVFQATLGVEAWLAKFPPGWPAVSAEVRPGRDAVRTLHVLVGAGVLATSVACALLMHATPGPADATHTEIDHTDAGAPAAARRGEFA
jgi:heme A synthase